MLRRSFLKFLGIFPYSQVVRSDDVESLCREFGWRFLWYCDGCGYRLFADRPGLDAVIARGERLHDHAGGFHSHLIRIEVCGRLMPLRPQFEFCSAMDEAIYRDIRRRHGMKD